MIDADFIHTCQKIGLKPLDAVYVEGSMPYCPTCGTPASEHLMTEEKRVSNQDTLLSDIQLHDTITALRKERSAHLMDESDYTQKILDLIKTQKRLYAKDVIKQIPQYLEILKYSDENDIAMEEAVVKAETAWSELLEKEQKLRIK